MLYIHDRTDEKGLKYIKFVDEYFNEHWQTVIKADNARMIMKKIDKVKKFTDDTMTTPFGTTVYTNLSTGCKTLLLANYSSRLLLDMRNVGNDVMRLAEELCDEDENYDLHFYPPDSYLVQTDAKIWFGGKIMDSKQAMNKYFDTLEAKCDT